MSGDSDDTALHAPGVGTAALHTFVEAEHALETSSLLNEGERSCVALEISNYADCDYCRSVFILEARRHGIVEADIAAMAWGGRPESVRCRLISHATRRILATGGRLGQAEIADLEHQGLDGSRLIEIVTVIGAYTIATFANNLSRTRIDPEFRVADPPQADTEG